jgi:hypothetical protein
LTKIAGSTLTPRVQVQKANMGQMMMTTKVEMTSGLWALQPNINHRDLKMNKPRTAAWLLTESKVME